MVTVVLADRKSAVLTPSSLACLSQIPTINLTAGCAHGCIYCYARGYTTYPGDGKVILYRNTLEKLQEELAHKRTKPQAVYFSPSSDLFQPVPEVLDLGHRVLKFLLSNGIGVAFLSKGHIPEETMGLLLKHTDKVRAQIGIITVDEDVQRMFEPNAASPSVRLQQMARLIAGGIETEARIIPILPGFTDGPDALGRLFSAVARTGVRRAAASALFLRSSVVESIMRNVLDKDVLKRLLNLYTNAKRLATRAEHSYITALPCATREEIFKRCGGVGKKYSVELSICACMNTDIGSGVCNISGTWLKRQDQDLQPSLFVERG